ncbi:MAG: HAMP domain-containing histidine kinase, partial [Thermomicrobiales bacterium]|nr:HAMP domain-containing histidine kinase [Thermomicrobiales bacterium]
LLVALVFCVIVGGFLWSWQGSPGVPGPGDRHRGPAIFPIVAFFLLAILFLIGARGVRSLRENAVALDDVLANVNRVAAGDYEVQTTARGWTETRELARSVDLMATRLRTAEARRTAFQADIAHELRTPLSVIQGTTEGMLDGVYARDDEHLELVLRRSRMMAKLLDDFQLLASADAGVLLLHREPIDLAELLDKIAADFRPAAAAKGVQVTRTGFDSLEADFDSVRMSEVLDNLMRNAVQHTDPGDRIELGADAVDGSVRIWVRDTGTGIPPERMATIFDRYAKSADSGGSGLGLAIARRLVDAHGGTISVESAAGSGTTFTMFFPGER